MEQQKWFSPTLIILVLTLSVGGILYCANQKWLFTPPQTWLFYHQTLIASLIALLSVVGVWINARLQAVASNKAEERAIKRRQRQIGSTLAHLFGNYVHIMISQYDHNRRNQYPTRNPISLDAFVPFQTEIALLPGEAGGATVIAYNNILFLNQEIEASINKVKKLEEERKFLSQVLLEKGKPGSKIVADYQTIIDKELASYRTWHLEYLDKVLPYMSQLCAWLEAIKDGDLEDIAVPKMKERFGVIGNNYLMMWGHGPAIEENQRRMEEQRAQNQ